MKEKFEPNDLIEGQIDLPEYKYSLTTKPRPDYRGDFTHRERFGIIGVLGSLRRTHSGKPRKER